MNKFYLKNQFYIILILGVFSGYVNLEYKRNKEIITQNNIKLITITDKKCGSNGANSLNFVYDKKKYNTKILGKNCTDLNIGDGYKLYYSDKKDIFLDKASVEHSRKGVIVSLIIFLISLLPFKIFTKNND